MKSHGAQPWFHIRSVAHSMNVISRIDLVTKVLLANARVHKQICDVWVICKNGMIVNSADR